MEFVKVTYPVVREVILDGGPCGNTNEVLKTSAGTHDFDLGAPLDYAPATQTIQVRNTSKTSPLIVVFLPKLVTPVVPVVVLAAAPSRRRKVAKKAATKGARKTAKTAAKTPEKKAMKKAARKATKTAKKVAKKVARKRT